MNENVDICKVEKHKILRFRYIFLYFLSKSKHDINSIKISVAKRVHIFIG